MMNARRNSIVEEAKRWIGTPYKNVGCIRGVGANCAMLLFGVAKAARAVPLGAPEPRWYTPQLHLHSREERLVEYVKAYGAREVSEEEVGPGDIILFKTGQSHGHAGIVVEYPQVMVHTTAMTGCVYAHCTNEGYLAQKARRYFTLS